MGDHVSNLTERTKNTPLDGMSRYALDYVKHPYAKPDPYQPPNALDLHDEPLGKTTYRREYLTPCIKDRSVWVQLAREAFEGQTAEGLRQLAEEAMRNGGT